MINVGISWVPWGCSVPWGDTMSTVGVILSIVGDVQYRGGGGYHDACGGISWVPWRVFSTVGGKSFVIWVPHGTAHPPRYSWYPPHVSWYPPRHSNFKGWYPPTVLMISPHGTEHPHGTQDIPPHLSWYPPTVLNTPHGTHDIPHGTEHPHGTAHTLYRDRGGYHDACGGISWVPWRVFSTVGGKSFVIWVPHGTAHPPRYSWYPPTCIMISPTALKFQRMVSPHGTHDIPPWYWTPPRYSRYPPTFIMISPHGTEHPPTVLMISPTVLSTPHGTAHTLYRVVHHMSINASFKLQLHDAIYRLRLCSNSLIHILLPSNWYNNVASIQKNRAMNRTV